MHHDLKLCKRESTVAQAEGGVCGNPAQISEGSPLTINSDLAVSIFVCSFEERFCLVVREISSFFGKALEDVPAKRERERARRGAVVPSGAGRSAYWSHLSSSSSIKPLPSTSRTLKTSLTLSGDMALRPTNSKNFFGSKVSSKGEKRRQNASAFLFAASVF